MVALIILISILAVLLIIYFILCGITVSKMVGRGKEVPLIDLDLSKTQYKPYENTVREAFKYFDNIKPIECEIEAYDGIKLYGYYYPNKLNTLVICFHGYRATPLNNYAVMGSALYEKGYSLLMIVERGHGKSGGKYTTFSDKEKYDCISWINYANKEYNPERIFLYGLSLGAATILMATSLNMPSVVKGLIADSGFDAAKNGIYCGMKRFMGPIAYPLFPGVRLLLFILGIKVSKNKIYKALESNEIPILFIHGTNDKLIPIELGMHNYNSTKGKKEFVKTEAGHVLSIYTDYELVLNKMLEFIDNN